MEELIAYKESLYQSLAIDSDVNEVFSEESYFDYVCTLLSDAGILDNVEYCPYRNTRKGIRIDGYSWNVLEKTIYGIVLNFSNEVDSIGTLTNTEIKEAGKRVSRFFESVCDDKFFESLEVTDPGRVAGSDVRLFLEEAIKFRVVVLTDQVLSTRVKKLSIDPILDRDTSIEIWDIERLQGLESSGSEYEEFIVDFDQLGGSVRALPANVSENGVSTYLAIMPADLLSSIYDEFGQRLLESNVRTFLDFRATTNKGMRKSLVTEPEHFFAYNNGLTVTATKISTKDIQGQLHITSLENMQIVNGGQTTAAIYFSPREKGGIRGAETTLNYKDIDLEKVYVQMKLTVIADKEQADSMKANIATYANSQNAIQQSDLVSNHPFHLYIETRSRKQAMPAGENGLSTKWFYERARGQYSTQLRGLMGQAKRKFETEYPKKQVFNKTDMAKYENTWRMKPYIVKKGAQANLKSLGSEIVKEFERDEAQFGASFFNDLVSKMILFRSTDFAILQADWYKQERGLKAEIVTYSIALLRHKLLSAGKDIDLDSIFKRQNVSERLLEVLVEVARSIRNSITDFEFTDGVTNPSEFCKSEKGWLKLQSLDLNLSQLGKGDVLSANEIKESNEERRSKNETGQTISGVELVMSVTAKEWDLIAEFNSRTYPNNHKAVGIPRKCAGLHRGGTLPSDKQIQLAKEIRDSAYEQGFDYAG